MPKPTPGPERHYTIREAMRLLDERQGTLLDWRMSGEGPRYVLKSGKVRYPATALAEWLTRYGTNASQEAAPDANKPRQRALCCECGTLRTIAESHRPREWSGEGRHSNNAGRWLGDLTCETCRQTTRHALLRDGSDHADHAEDSLRAPTAHKLACDERDALIRLIEGFNVEVRFCAFKKSSKKEMRKGTSYVISANFGDGQWSFGLNEAAAPHLHTAGLKSVWAQVASDTFAEDITWDPRDGWAEGADSDVWETTAQDTMDDIERFLEVERLRMVAELRDSAEPPSPRRD